jgi:hypothetical protein
MRIQIQGAKPMQIHADPDPDKTLKSTIEFLHEKKIYLKLAIGQKHTYERTKRQETRFICYFGSISMLLDPDPHSQYGFGSRTAKSIRIRIHNHLKAWSSSLCLVAWYAVF